MPRAKRSGLRIDLQCLHRAAADRRVYQCMHGFSSRHGGQSDSKRCLDSFSCLSVGTNLDIELISARTAGRIGSFQDKYEAAAG